MAILFDLDGTLLDTSYDIHAAVNTLLADIKKAPLDYDTVRSRISSGSSGILSATIRDPKPHIPKLIDICLADGFKHARLFPGMDNLLRQIEQTDLRWGIVTNRLEAMTIPLLEATGLLSRAACVVCADTSTAPKPSPAPLLHACKQLNITPDKCVFIGDSVIDIEAGRAAGMSTIAVAYGYGYQDSTITDWQADYIANNAEDILAWINSWEK